MNKIILVGNLTKDPDYKTNAATAAGYVLFGLAVRRGVDKNGEQITDFFDCIAGGKLGEAIERYTKKGDKIAVGGQIATRNVQDKDGKTRRYYSVIVSDCEFCQPKPKTEGTKAEGVKAKPATESPTWEEAEFLPF